MKFAKLFKIDKHFVTYLANYKTENFELKLEIIFLILFFTCFTLSGNFILTITKSAISD